LKLAIKIFEPEEMARLLSYAKGDQIVALAVMGFAGIRAEEFKRLQWEHIDFGEGHIIVPDTIAKCQERRIAPLLDNLRAWLLSRTVQEFERANSCGFSIVVAQ